MDKLDNISTLPACDACETRLFRMYVMDSWFREPGEVGHSPRCFLRPSTPPPRGPDGYSVSSICLPLDTTPSTRPTRLDRAHTVTRVSQIGLPISSHEPRETDFFQRIDPPAMT